MKRERAKSAWRALKQDPASSEAAVAAAKAAYIRDDDEGREEEGRPDRPPRGDARVNIYR